MAKEPKAKHPGRRGLRVSLYPLTADQAVRGIFRISKDDVKRIVGKKPGRKKKA